MTLNQIVEEYKKEHVLRLYKEHPDEITRDYINENEMRDDYEGREVLELIQNAVDQVEVGGKIFIGLKDGILTVANTGVPFNFPGVKSLMKSNLSPKRLSKNTIGQKGLGFRALLNWSDDISIYSDNLSIRFSEIYRKSYFKEENISEPTALLVAPEIIKNIDKNGYDTVINIKIMNEIKTQEVKRQLRKIDKYTLLFLNKINELTVKIEDEIFDFKREADQNIVKITENDNQYIFNTFSKNGVINEKNYEIVIAYDESILPKDNKLYSFFETNINFPIKWKCHATFELETNRSGIKKNEDNLRLLSELADFICEKAEQLKSSENQPYEAFDSLIKTSEFSAGLNIKGIDFNETFKNVFENAKLLPTYTKNRTSLKDGPIFYESVPFFFNVIANTNILIESKDKNRNAIIEKFSKKIDDNSLIEIINSHSKNWDVKQNILVLLWWGKEFAQSKRLPNLIKSTDGEYIKSDSIIYFVRGRNLNIPSWSKIYQLDPVFEEELKKQLLEIESFSNELNNESSPIIERVIARNSGRSRYYNDKKIIPHIIFRDADASTILSPVNSSVGNNYENAKLFVKWLWENYSNKEDWVAPQDMTFNLPSKEHSVDKANNLFFNENYDNPLANKLFFNEKYKAFISYKEIGITQDEMHDFKKFFSKLEVMCFPPLEVKSVQDNGFRKLFTTDYLNKKLPRNEVDPRNPHLVTIAYNAIENLEETLLNLTIGEIFEWILSDSKLHDELSMKHAGKITFNYTAQVQAYRTLSFYDYSISYIKYIFQNTKWLEIDGDRYSPNQCVFAYNGLDITNIAPTISNKWVKELSDIVGISQKEIRLLLSAVGVNNSLTGLKSNEFYRVLLELPTYDESGQISEKIYREVIDIDGDIATDSSNYRKFINEGFVFTQNHDGKKYHLASESYFSNRIQVNVGNHHIMRTPIRNGSFEIFKKVFGIKKFEEKYQVQKESIVLHRLNNDFQQNFKEFLTYARAWTERNDNIKKRLENIRASIVSQIILFDNDETQAINSDYMLITDQNQWLIYVSDVRELDYRQISKCVEEMFAQIANTTNSEIPNQLGELFRDRDGRKFLVEKHFGSINAINQVFHNQIKISLAESLDMKYDAIEFEDIDFSHFSEVYNSNKLINLLSSKNLDLKDLKEKGFEYIEYIDLRPHHQMNIKKYIATNEEKYKNILFMKYQTKDFGLKKAFYREFLRFKNFTINIEDIENSVYFDGESVIKKRFPDLENISSEIYADTIYNENFSKLSNGLNVQKFGDFIDENIIWKSSIYFLDDEISKLIIDDFHKKIEAENDEVKYDIDNDTNRDNLILCKSEIIPGIAPNHKTRTATNGNTNTKSSIEKSNHIKDKNGRDAEKKVRDLLVITMPSLRWTSENSNIPSERNTSALYDMEYMSEGHKNYIEVKAAISSFYMSLSEYNFAKKNSDNYEIYLVDLENNKIDGPHRLSDFEPSKISTEFQFFFGTK